MICKRNKDFQLVCQLTIGYARSYFHYHQVYFDDSLKVTPVSFLVAYFDFSSWEFDNLMFALIF